MNELELLELLEQVKAGTIGPDDALNSLRRLPFADLGHAKIDHHRNLRTGVPEAIYGPNKSPEQCVSIVAELLENGSGPVLLTRASEPQINAVADAHPGGLVVDTTVVWRSANKRDNKVVVASAGTADLPVAEEAIETARLMGCNVDRIVDVGVAGLHRTLNALPALRAAKVLVVVAGMEGALPSVVAGLVKAPVIAVPTSTGYGASLGGIAALLAMLNSCATGIAVVNIDNGFGAAVMATKIARSIAGRD